MTRLRRFDILKASLYTRFFHRRLTRDDIHWVAFRRACTINASENASSSVVVQLSYLFTVQAAKIVYDLFFLPSGTGHKLSWDNYNFVCGSWRNQWPPSPWKNTIRYGKKILIDMYCDIHKKCIKSIKLMRHFFRH